MKAKVTCIVSCPFIVRIMYRKIYQNIKKKYYLVKSMWHISFDLFYLLLNLWLNLIHITYSSM